MRHVAEYSPPKLGEDIAQFSKLRVLRKILMTGITKAVSVISSKAPIFHFDFTTPKGILQAMIFKREEKIGKGQQ